MRATAVLLALLPCCAAYVLPHAPSRGPAVESLARLAHGRVRQPRAQSPTTEEATDVAAAAEEIVMVKAPTCVSCETEWIEKSKVTEGAERIRLDKVRGEDLTGYINEVWECRRMVRRAVLAAAELATDGSRRPPRLAHGGPLGVRAERRPRAPPQCRPGASSRRRQERRLTLTPTLTLTQVRHEDERHAAAGAGAQP